MEHIILTIVEAERVPSGMLMAITRIEELVRITSEVTQTFHLVLHSVRVYDIHNHSHTVLVSLVDESLQFLRGTEARTGGEER